MKAFKRVRLIFVSMTLLATLLNVGLVNSGDSFACTPDPSDPLKCFCEEVRGGEDGAIVEEGGDSDVCDISDNERNDDKKGLLGEEGIVKRVLNLMTWLTGLLAVIYVLIGGFKFITSGGDADSVASARKMILFALAGVAVVILSNVIISFVIGLVNVAS
jgi:hypothetical protein